MKILPIAFDSFGVRSMATYIETRDVRIFIDPGISLSPDRYSLPPHRIELDRHRELWEKVKHWVGVSDIIVITHYHFDHHNPDEEAIYHDKDIFLKHPRESINFSQQERAAQFLRMTEHCAKNITIVDGKTFTFGATRLEFSQPVFHGLSAQLGFVVEVLIEEDEKFVYTSDVQGPLHEDAVKFIIDAAPDIVIVDGPATYLVGSHYKKGDITLAQDNLKKIVTQTPVQTLIIDHHLLRDIAWREHISPLSAVKRQVRICCAAEYLGVEENMLEARRQELYQGSNSGKTC